MNKRLRAALFALFGVVFLYSAGQVVYSVWGYRQGADTYDQAENLANLPDFTQISLPAPQQPEQDDPDPRPEEPQDPQVVYLEALKAINMQALRDKNAETLGWILIPGSTISYPVMHGQDNSYYLSYAWNKTRSFVGSIFLDYRNSGDWSDFNSIVYGHNMRDGSMFSTLKSYEDPAFWQRCPLIYIADGQTIRRYHIFAAYEVSVEGLTYSREFGGEQEKQAFIDYCLAQSAYDTGVVPTPEDSILTLSTCTGRGNNTTRWVVQALLEPEPPAEEGADQSEGEVDQP